MARSLNDEEKLLVRRAYDKLELCEKRYTVTYAGFLNEKEQDILIPEFERIYEQGGCVPGACYIPERCGWLYPRR